MSKKYWMQELNIIVAGSAVFKGDPAENTKAMMEILKTYE